jgi:hypothetical protein
MLAYKSPRYAWAIAKLGSSSMARLKSGKGVAAAPVARLAFTAAL